MGEWALELPDEAPQFPWVKQNVLSTTYVLSEVRRIENAYHDVGFSIN